jgi:hypothetical protein
MKPGTSGTPKIKKQVVIFSSKHVKKYQNQIHFHGVFQVVRDASALLKLGQSVTG